jgi:hypothetical protein
VRLVRSIVALTLIASTVVSASATAASPEPDGRRCGRIAVPDVPGSPTAAYYPFAVSILQGETTCLAARRTLRGYHIESVSPQGWQCARWHGSREIAATCLTPDTATDLADADVAIRSYPDRVVRCAQTLDVGNSGVVLQARRLRVTGGLGCRAGARVVRAYLRRAVDDVIGCAGPAVNAPYAGCVVGAFRCRATSIVHSAHRFCSDRGGRRVEWRERDVSIG